MAGRPTAAFILSLVGGICYLLMGALITLALAVLSSFPGMTGISAPGILVGAVGGIGLISGVLMIVGSLFMQSSEKSRIRVGSVIVLVFAVVGAVFTIGGLVIGFVLALLGSILGLTWKPKANELTAPA